MIYGIATAMLSNKSIVCRVRGGSEHQRVGWISLILSLSLSRGEEPLARGEFKDRTPALLCARGRKYFNTDACNIKGAKAVRTAIIRVLDERTERGARTSEGALTPPRPCTCTARAHARRLKIYVAYLRVRKARTFTGVREIIYSGIDFPRASHALLSRHTALMIHLQLAPRGGEGGRRDASAHLSRRSREAIHPFRALSRRNTTLRNY